jgi:selenocysteine-specific elongation factor
MIVGTAGHIDHGKTALVRALTGVDTDRLKEEKARGISIDLGFAYMPAGEGETLGFIDAPGHERFVHTMLAGASGIDFVLLAIAADDGVMPQTREHLAIVDLLGVGRGCVALTKTDLVDDTRLLEVSDEIACALVGTCLEAAPIMPVSAVTGEGVVSLRMHLVKASGEIGNRAASGRFRLAVDRCFTIVGAGTIVTGTVLSGRAAVGDHVVVSPSGLRARVRSIRAQDAPAEFGKAGDRCGINLAGDGVGKDAISRGDVVLDPTLHAPADHIDASFRVLAGEPKSIGQWFPVRLHHGAQEVGARIVLLGDPISPGASGRVQLVLEQPIAAAAGDRYVVRDTSARRTIGGGVFLDLRGPSRKRRTPERLAQLDALALAEPASAVAALLDIAPFHLDLTNFCRDRALAVTEANVLAERLGLVRISAGETVLAVSAARWELLRQMLLSRLESFHADNPDLPGLGRERLRLQLEPRLPAPAFGAALLSLAQAGELSLDGAWVKLAGFEVRLAPRDEVLWAQVRPLLGGTDRFRPPRVRDIATIRDIGEPEVRHLLKLLGRLGRVDEVAHDHFFLRGAVAEMVDILCGLSQQAEGAQFTAAQFRDQVENGRKVAIQILEFFDRHGVTLRRGDLRRINRHRLDLFRDPAEYGPANEVADQPPWGRETSLVGRPDFKSGRGREPVSGGFDSHSLPPVFRGRG